MKTLIVCFALISAGLAHAAESATGQADDAKRSVKKTVHHVEEAVCAEGDAKCAAKKVKHRVNEGADYAKDKVKEGEKKVK